MEVGNMEDINKMSLLEFNNLLNYLEKKEKIRKHEPIPLRDSEKEMIKKAKKGR